MVVEAFVPMCHIERSCITKRPLEDSKLTFPSISGAMMPLVGRQTFFASCEFWGMFLNAFHWKSYRYSRCLFLLYRRMLQSWCESAHQKCRSRDMFDKVHSNRSKLPRFQFHIDLFCRREKEQTVPKRKWWNVNIGFNYSIAKNVQNKSLFYQYKKVLWLLGRCRDFFSRKHIFMLNNIASWLATNRIWLSIWPAVSTADMMLEWPFVLADAASGLHARRPPNPRLHPLHVSWGHARWPRWWATPPAVVQPKYINRVADVGCTFSLIAPAAHSRNCPMMVDRRYAPSPCQNRHVIEEGNWKTDKTARCAHILLSLLLLFFHWRSNRLLMAQRTSGLCSLFAPSLAEAKVCRSPSIRDWRSSIDKEISPWLMTDSAGIRMTVCAYRVWASPATGMRFRSCN